MKNPFFYLVALTIIVLSSCNKNNITPDMDSIIGTYKGSINYSTDSSVNNATTDISRADDYSVFVHCYSNDFDTTFTMDVYQEGNTVYCNNGGYSDNSDHMSEMSQHCNTQEHHGSFDINNKAFKYTFDTHNIESFTGVRE